MSGDMDYGRLPAEDEDHFHRLDAHLVATDTLMTTLDDVQATIERLKHEGIGAVVVEQNAEVALAVADKVLILDNGKLAWVGTAEELRDDSALKRRLLGE